MVLRKFFGILKSIQYSTICTYFLSDKDSFFYEYFIFYVNFKEINTLFERFQVNGQQDIWWQIIFPFFAQYLLPRSIKHLYCNFFFSGINIDMTGDMNETDIIMGHEDNRPLGPIFS